MSVGLLYTVGTESVRQGMTDVPIWFLEESGKNSVKSVGIKMIPGKICICQGSSGDTRKFWKFLMKL